MAVPSPSAVAIRHPGTTLRLWVAVICGLCLAGARAAAVSPLHLPTGQASPSQYVDLYLPEQGAKAAELGLDPQRIYLLGHGAGGQLVTLLSLQPQWLRRHGLKPADIAGVISLSGIHDLMGEQGKTETQLGFEHSDFGTEPAARRGASPLQQVRHVATRYLVLSAATDLSGYVLDAQHFAEAMRAAGNDLIYQILGELNHFTIADLGNPHNRARQVVLDFMGVAPLRRNSRTSLPSSTTPSSTRRTAPSRSGSAMVTWCVITRWMRGSWTASTA